jgi:RNase adapter protein RapZ
MPEDPGRFSAEDPGRHDADQEGLSPVDQDIVVITGMSGAGRSEAIHTFEDLGYFCIDNLPPALMRQFVKLTGMPGSLVRRVAVVCDVRGLAFFDKLPSELDKLEATGHPFRLLYLEADDRTLVNRFKETRRRHPLAESTGGLASGVAAEREALRPVRERADTIIDTSDLPVQQLRAVIRERFTPEDRKGPLVVTVSSFGFKYGLPIDADIVMDVRFLPNPYYKAELRELTGQNAAVREFVLERTETKEFLGAWFELLSVLMPGYSAEGKTHLSIMMGCTGGMHRSVVLADETADFLRHQGFDVNVSHRDMGKDRIRR